ncbi:hypothetical protein G6L37_06315 [Agrobacterium rubi]|nr:hypothetical protein [Agrobacterium rubi]NTF24976.1 hypothetical protein [Agrobacterium rubi]
MRETITIPVAVSDAEDFVRRMSSHGFEAVTSEQTRGEAWDYQFARFGKIDDMYAAFIDYRERTATISIRPR